MRYLVMETQTSFAIVMDEMSRCYIAANMGYEVGQFVEEAILKKEYKPAMRSGRGMATGIISAVAACLLIFFGLYSYMANNRIYGSVYMSINPEIQMDINKNGKVVNITALNDKGTLLIGDAQYEGRPVSEVCKMLTEQAIDTGVLADGGAVLFEIDTSDEALFQSIGIDIRREAGAAMQGRVDAELYVTNYNDSFTMPVKTATPEPTPEPTPTPSPTPTPEPTPEPTPSETPQQDTQDEAGQPVIAPNRASEASSAPTPKAAATSAPAPSKSAKPAATAAPAPTKAPPAATQAPAPAPAQPAAPVQNDSGYDDGDSGYDDDGDSGYDDD